MENGDWSAYLAVGRLGVKLLSWFDQEWVKSVAIILGMVGIEHD